MSVQILADIVKASPDVRPLTPAEADAVTRYDPATGELLMRSAPASATDITQGDILPVPPTIGDPSGALVTVEAVTNSAGSTTFRTTDATLPEAVISVPDAAAGIGMSLITSNFEPEDGVTVAQQARPRTTSPHSGLNATVGSELRLNVDVSRKVGAVEAGLAGEITVEPLIEFEFDMDWLELKKYRLGTGIRTTNSLEATLGTSYNDTLSIPLGKVTYVYGGLVGPVPVWVQSEIGVVAEVDFTGTVEIVAGLENTGAVTAGITNRSADSLAPKPYADLELSTNLTLDLRAKGTVEAFEGVRGSLYLHSAAGPDFKVGAQQEFEIQASLSAGLSCTARAGTVAEFGFEATEFIEKLTGRSERLALSRFDNLKTDENACKQATTPARTRPRPRPPAGMET